MLTIEQLYDLNHTLAADYLRQFTYPWEALVGIKAEILHTAAFPSSHVGISTILMIMAWRGSKWLFAILMPFYVLLCCATVYIQAHYLIDAVVGFVSAFVMYVLVTKMFKKWFAVPMFK